MRRSPPIPLATPRPFEHNLSEMLRKSADRDIIWAISNNVIRQSAGREFVWKAILNSETNSIPSLAYA